MIQTPHSGNYGGFARPLGQPIDPFSLFSGMSGGRSRGPRAVTEPFRHQPEDPRGLPGSTVNNPNATGKKPQAGNTGFERFLAVHRGSRGGRLSGKKGFTYTGGPYKGMTQGQGDVEAHRKWQAMAPDARENYMQQNSADLAASREREIQAMRDQFALAREFQAQIRSDIREEDGAGGVAPPVKKFDPGPSKSGGDTRGPVNPNATAGAGRGRPLKKKEKREGALTNA